MKTGISTACFYPNKIHDSLAFLASSGIKHIEIFFNTFRELQPAYLAKLKTICDREGLQIVSVHPFLSPIEPMMFFSVFEGRLEDGIELYKPFFEAAAQLGAKYFVFHGSAIASDLSPEFYCDRFAALNRAAKAFGVTVLQENVVRNQCASADFVSKIKSILGNEIEFVLDLKQLIRSNCPLEQMLAAMGNAITHVHASDNTAASDCVLPGKGRFDFVGLAHHLKRMGFQGVMMLELYRQNYESPAQVAEACKWLDAVIGKL